LAADSAPASSFAHSSRALYLTVSHIKALLTHDRSKLSIQIKPSLRQNVGKGIVITDHVICRVCAYVQTSKDLQFLATTLLGPREKNQQFGGWCET